MYGRFLWHALHANNVTQGHGMRDWGLSKGVPYSVRQLTHDSTPQSPRPSIGLEP